MRMVNIVKHVLVPIVSSIAYILTIHFGTYPAKYSSLCGVDCTLNIRNPEVIKKLGDFSL